MVPNSKSRQAVLTSSKLQSALGTNKKRQFQRNSIFLFNSGRESQAKKTLTASTNWFGFSSHLEWARSQTTNHPSGLVLLAKLPLFRNWKGITATWSFNMVQRQSKLLMPTGQMGTARTTESSRRPWSGHSVAGLNFAVHFAGSLLTALHCLKTFYSFMLSFIEIIYRTPHSSPLFTKYKQRLSAYCVPTHWVYSPSKPRLTFSLSTLLTAMFPDLFSWHYFNSKTLEKYLIVM